MFTDRLFYTLASFSWYSTESRLGEPHKSSGHFGEKKNVLPLPRIKTRCIVIQPIAESLSQTHYVNVPIV